MYTLKVPLLSDLYQKGRSCQDILQLGVLRFSLLDTGEPSAVVASHCLMPKDSVTY